MTPISDAIGGMKHYARWFIWRLSNWNGKKWEEKEPIAHDGLTVPRGVRFNALGACMAGQLLDFDNALAWLNYWRTQQHGGVQYSLGWYVMPDAGYWFVDIDQCITWGDDGQPVLSGLAMEAMRVLPGCMGEYSSSNRGLHIIGRGALPAGHKVKGKGMPDGMELYSRERGICFGLSGQAWGNADVAGAPPWIVMEAVNTAGVDVSQRMAEWSGPEDDDELIKKMLNRRGESVKELLGELTLKQLWEGDKAAICRKWADAAEKDGRCSDADASLAAHLAWWTGADVPRMERLMWRSALVRDKWSSDAHRTYLADTCRNAAAHMVASGRGCYSMAPKVAPAAPVALPPMPMLPALPPVVEEPEDTTRGIGAANEAIARAGNVDELQAVCVRIASMGPWNEIEQETIAQRLGRKSKELSGEKWSIALCRKLVKDGRLTLAPGEVGAPDWVQEWVYLAVAGKYCHVDGNFALVGRESIHAMLCTLPDVPCKPSGDKMDVHKLMTEVWGVRIAHDVGYDPRQGLIYTEGGQQLLNMFWGSMPEPEPYMPHVVEAYKKHLLSICNNDEINSQHLLFWLAHQVQKPGVLMRWAVLLIGKGGTGKTTVHKVLQRALGRRNVKVTNSGAVNNKGGFMDWAARNECLGVLEDLEVTGPEKYQIYGKMKPVISDDYATVTLKGATDVTYRNFANYIGGTNRRDALPITESNDRRWFMLATDLHDAWVTNNPTEASNYFKQLNELFDSMSDGAWRAFFESVQIPQQWYSENVRAPATATLRTMQASAESEALTIIRDIVEGSEAVPITELTKYIKNYYKMVLREHENNAPKGPAIKNILQDLGYKIADDRKVKIAGVAQRVYTKNNWLVGAAINDEARKFAEKMVAKVKEDALGMFGGGNPLATVPATGVSH